MHIGLYFGSFNPVHNGHLIIANYVAYNTTIDQVWLVLSPHNPLKVQASLLNEYQRLHLIQEAILHEKKLKVSTIEFNLPKPSYTIDTMAYITEKYPKHTFSIIMGSDSYMNIQHWKNYETLMATYKLYIYLRPGYDVNNNLAANIEVLKAPLLDISSTQIRKMIQAKHSIRYWVPDMVLTAIENSNLYSLQNKTEN